jgi:hypothetical protein
VIIQDIQRKIGFSQIDQNLFDYLQNEILGELEKFHEKFLSSAEFKSLMSSQKVSLPPLKELVPDYFRLDNFANARDDIEFDDEEMVEEETEGS